MACTQWSDACRTVQNFPLESTLDCSAANAPDDGDATLTLSSMAGLFVLMASPRSWRRLAGCSTVACSVAIDGNVGACVLPRLVLLLRPVTTLQPLALIQAGIRGSMLYFSIPTPHRPQQAIFAAFTLLLAGWQHWRVRRLARRMRVRSQHAWLMGQLGQHGWLPQAYAPAGARLPPCVRALERLSGAASAVVLPKPDRPATCCSHASTGAP